MEILTSSSLYQKLRFRVRARRYAKNLDPCEIRFLRRLLNTGDVAIDIGAHKGAYLYWLQKAVSSSGRVLAFEPQRELARYLSRMKDLFRFEHVEVLNCAVSNVAGTRPLFCPPGRVSTGATLVENLFPENTAVNQVDVVTLDAYLSKRPDLQPPRFIKIDVETHELEVLEGGRRVLGTARPVVQLEADQHVYRQRSVFEIFEFLASLRLSGFFFFYGRLLRLEEFDLSTHQPSTKSATPTDRGYATNFIFLDEEKDGRVLRGYGVPSKVDRQVIRAGTDRRPLDIEPLGGRGV